MARPICSSGARRSAATSPPAARAGAAASCPTARSSGGCCGAASPPCCISRRRAAAGPADRSRSTTFAASRELCEGRSHPVNVRSDMPRRVLGDDPAGSCGSTRELHAPSLGGGRGRRRGAVRRGDRPGLELLAGRRLPLPPARAWRRIAQLQAPVRIAAGLRRPGGSIPAAARAVWRRSRCSRATSPPSGSHRPMSRSWPRARCARRGTAPEFLARARAQTGLEIRTLSAEEEAHYGYLAAVNSTTLCDGLALDLGGGSLQLVGVRDRAAEAFASWPLGAVRVSESLLPGHARGRAQAAQARPRGAARADGRPPGPAQRTPAGWSAWAAPCATSPAPRCAPAVPRRRASRARG